MEDYTTKANSPMSNHKLDCLHIGNPKVLQYVFMFYEPLLYYKMYIMCIFSSGTLQTVYVRLNYLLIFHLFQILRIM